MQCQKRTDTTFACPLVGRRDLERRQAFHRDKISRMGSSIDTTSPMPQPHLTLYGRDYASKKRATTEAAFSDLKMIQSIAKTMTRKASIPERKGPVSLNADARKTEIFRIMKENHRLLDRLETLEPIVSTSDMLREYKAKSRYTILVSHSKRLAGEYDAEVTRIRTEDQAKTDAMNRSVHLRLTKYKMRQTDGSMSMPSLTPLAATDPCLSTATASPAPPKQRVTRPLGSPGGLPATQAYPSSSSKSVPAAASPPTAASVRSEASQGEGSNSQKRDSKVSFLAQETTEEPRSEWQRGVAPTPYAANANSDMFAEEKLEEEQPSAGVSNARGDVATEASPTIDPASPVAAETSAPADLASATTPASETAPAQESDPSQQQPAENKVGVAVTSVSQDSGADGRAGDSYEEDFADASNTVGQSETFEESTDK